MMKHILPNFYSIEDIEFLQSLYLTEADLYAIHKAYANMYKEYPALYIKEELTKFKAMVELAWGDTPRVNKEWGFQMIKDIDEFMEIESPDGWKHTKKEWFELFITMMETEF